MTAQWCLDPQRCIALEVAATPLQQRIGLMQRPALPPLRGMWFPFDRPQPLRFWMLNTLAPLDMVFVRDNRVLAIEAEVPICPALPCRGYGRVSPAMGWWSWGLVRRNDWGSRSARESRLTRFRNDFVSIKV